MNTYPTLRPITECSVPLPTRLERALCALRRLWTVIRGVTFPGSATVPVALQPQPIWRCRAPLRVSDSVGDVLGVRRGEPTGSKESGVPRTHRPYVQTSFKSVLSLRPLSSTRTPPGWEMWTSRMDVTRVGYHLETFCLPQATLRSQLEHWRAGR